jgi:hypothetical protein
MGYTPWWPGRLDALTHDYVSFNVTFSNLQLYGRGYTETSLATHHRVPVDAVNGEAILTMISSLAEGCRC